MKKNGQIIDLKSVCVSYGEKQILHDCHFSVDAGESVALLGPNGAGKTTLLEVIGGFRRPSNGYVRVFGDDPLGFDPVTLGRIGIVLQNWRDHSFWRVRDIIDLVEYSHRQLGRGTPESTSELVAMLGISELLDSRLLMLSGGQRRRVDMCLALLSQPELLILDEPTTAFDPKLRREFHELISNMRNEATTVLWATHDLTEAESNCERIIILNKGRIVRDATPTELRSEVEDYVVVQWRDSAGNQCSKKVNDPDAMIRQLVVEGGTNIRVSVTSFEDVYLDLIKRTNGGYNAPIK